MSYRPVDEKAIRAFDVDAQIRQRFEQALSLYEKLEVRLGQAQTLKSLGDVVQKEIGVSEARLYYKRGLPLVEGVGDFTTQMNILWFWGIAEYQAKEIQTGCDLCRRALALADSHPSFAKHPAVQRWHEQFVAMRCDDL